MSKKFVLPVSNDWQMEYDWYDLGKIHIAAKIRYACGCEYTMVMDKDGKTPQCHGQKSTTMKIRSGKMTKYPESEKLLAVREESQKLGEFITQLKSKVELASWEENEDDGELDQSQIS